MDKMTFVDSFCPKIRSKNKGESNADYHAYISPILVDALLGNDAPVPYQINFKTSPLWQLKQALNDDPNVTDWDAVERLISVMRTLRMGMSQLKSLDDQMNFYRCWDLYRQGTSYGEIFKLTDKVNAWDGSEDTVIRKLKRWVLKYGWTRELT